MNITSITFEFPRYPSVIFRSTPEGVEFSTHRGISRHVALDGDNTCNPMTVIQTYVDLYKPLEMKITMSSFDDNMFYREYDRAEIVALNNADRFMSFERVFESMEYTCKLLRKREAIKGKDCPVLLTPLTELCLLLKKCNHHISREAWNGLELTPDGRKCPLCRALHFQMDVV